MRVEDAGASVAWLDALRAEIAQVDRNLVGLIAERVRLSGQAAVAKRSGGLPILDPAHEAHVVRRAAELAREAGLPAEELRDLFWRLIGMSRRLQADGGER